MKTNDVVKLLIPGVIVGILLGFGLAMIVGVNKEDPIPNYIGWSLCCFIPTLLNCTIVLKTGSKVLKRKISLSAALLRVIKYAVVAFLIGLFVIAVIVENVLGISSCDISVMMTAICQALLGVFVSTVMAYISLRRYEKSVKYKKRTAEEKAL